ncbi:MULTISPECIES: GNAT family N-acetyltransferase [Methylosinus]|uniref:N-acetyltransferase n=1 Tax=Methylosinus trichosporium (strain ATCC 35070 / NCIMB 11131 / UNIQEM 75 / OB3b) TaxID=595536 RepID=A0A2D2CY95_METT3|nr:MULTISPECIES: N-acetyltransferase [Methylosinus]ATQ67609.1 N-acetyltransferase [Methylosinus trichosporium OB3b]
MTFCHSFHDSLGPRAFRLAGAASGASLKARGPVFDIVDETPADVDAREALLDEAFGPARFLKTCERLRAGRRPARGLALVAMDDERLVATLRLWDIHAGPGRPALLLGPLAVARSHRSLGLGAAMIETGLARAAARGHGAVLLVGDAPYYERFGFDVALTEGLVMPGPVERERFLGLELIEGALAGAQGRVAATGERASRALRRAAPSARAA